MLTHGAAVRTHPKRPSNNTFQSSRHRAMDGTVPALRTSVHCTLLYYVSLYGHRVAIAIALVMPLRTVARPLNGERRRSIVADATSFHGGVDMRALFHAGEAREPRGALPHCGILGHRVAPRRCS